ncbi:hypothetical protein IB231_22215 [Pantoea sp. PNT02]|uniref:hypothetical protein n=1 Tax=Pantoea sp. PNT02 TaxID=2769261 RepID=UPI00177E639D|nr:hypothetical protein [Pantoea sp. PNT02]MBD9646340.1 hypothetical protein [Pantoea sp. PNT02]
MSQISQSVNREQFNRIESSDFAYSQTQNSGEGCIRTAEQIIGDIKQEKENSQLKQLIREIPVHPRMPLIRTAENIEVADLQWNSAHASQPSVDTFSLSESAEMAEDVQLKQLIREIPVHPRMPLIRTAENIATADLQWDSAHASQPSVDTYSLSESAVMTDNVDGVGSQTDEVKASAVSKYGTLVASTLATILGAVLVIVAKNHDHDEMSVETADDIGVQEPDYDAIRAGAEQEAQEAFEAKWHDPEMWGPGKVDGDGVNIETGEKNPYYSAEQDQTTGDFFIGDRLTPEGERTLSEVTKQAGDTAVAQAKADYDTALEAAQAHNTGHPDAQHSNNSSGKDHNAMLGIGATLIGVGGLATALIAGNKMTHHSHAKQQAQGQPIEHGPTKNFIEQQLFRVKA